MKDNKCRRCSCERDNGFPWERVYLIGGFPTRLCDDCLQEWHEWIGEQPELEVYHLTVSELSRAVRQGDGELLRAVTLLELMAKQAVYEIAKSWCQEREEAGAGVEEGNDDD